MDKANFSMPCDLKNVRITDDFWGREQELVRREVIPYQWEALNDRVPGAAPSFCMHNFKAAARLMQKKSANRDFTPPAYSFRGFHVVPGEGEAPKEDQFYGFVFQDSDFSKWIEAVGYSLALHPDPALERIADGAIDLVCAAQAQNGYLDTYYILNGMDRVFTNLRDHHELYCFGHLAEGAVAYYQATGKDKLLQAALRYADYIDSCFGEGEGKRKGYPGHEIAEMALARLYELTGEERYLRLSAFFLNMRGTQPFYFDEEAAERAAFEGKPYLPEEDPGRYAYHQAHLPVREQSEAVGHAVRAVYLYSGMADVARLTGDEELYKACRRLWDSITGQKLYVTGGIGGTSLGEAFSYPYDLPNDTAYSETCAAIGLVFFARRMLQMEADSRYGDVMELALYNTVLAGMALDGKSFFYVNPLEVVPEACDKDGRKRHVKPVRQKWFGCACCPPNIARTISSLGLYLYTEKEDTLYTHLYVGGSVTRNAGESKMELQVESAFPWEGKVTVTVHCKEAVETNLAFRIPGWCRKASVEIRRGHSTVVWVECVEGSPGRTAGQQDAGFRYRMEKGYLYLGGTWRESDQVLLEFPMEARLLQADARVREDVGKVAFTRGPLTYCAEEADNGRDLHLCRVDLQRLRDREDALGLGSLEIGGCKVRALLVPGKRRKASQRGGLYRDYREPEEEEVTLTLIPYYAWANRGEGEMRVWLEL